MIKFIELKDKLNNNNYNVLCLFGNDSWVKRRAVSNIMTAYNITDDGFSVDYLDEPTVSDIVLACSTPSMFCEKRLIVCQNFALPKNDKSKQGNFKQQISSVTENADGSFCLVFVCDDCKFLEGVANVETVDCNHLPVNSVSNWIVKFCKSQNVAVDSLCANKIATYCLCDMSRVESETQKLLDYGTITLDSIEQMVHKDVDYVVFDLSKHISNKNAGKAMELYRGLLSQGNEARQLFGLLYSFYRRVYYVKTSTCSDTELSTFLNVKQGAIGFAKEVAEVYKPMQLKRTLEYFEQADFKLKSFADENEIMTLLIMQLISL